MIKELPDHWHQTDTEVYFEGRPSMFLLFPTFLAAAVSLLIAAGCCAAIGWNDVAVEPGKIVEELRRSDPGTQAILILIAASAVLAAPLIVLVGTLKWLATRYRLTNDRIEYERGILSKKILNVELWRVRDVLYRRTLLQFFLGLGVIDIHATDATIPKLEIGPIRNARRIYDQLKQARLRSGRIAGAQAMGMSTSE